MDHILRLLKESANMILKQKSGLESLNSSQKRRFTFPLLPTPHPDQSKHSCSESESCLPWEEPGILPTGLQDVFLL